MTLLAPTLAENDTSVLQKWKGRQQKDTSVTRIIHSNFHAFKRTVLSNPVVFSVLYCAKLNMNCRTLSRAPDMLLSCNRIISMECLWSAVYTIL